MARPYRYRPSFGEVYGLFRGARPSTSPLPVDTSGLTLTQSFAIGASTTNAQVSVGLPAVFECDLVGLDGTGGGVIYEQGGSGNGCYIGFRTDGTFIARIGDGTAVEPIPVGTSYIDLPAGEISGNGQMVWEIFDSGGGIFDIRLFWKGFEYTSTQTSTAVGDWAGNNDGGYLTFTDSIAGGHPSNTVSYGTASSLSYYSNQTL